MLERDDCPYCGYEIEPDDVDDFISIANREERREALIKFFEYIVGGLKEE